MYGKIQWLFIFPKEQGLYGHESNKVKEMFSPLLCLSGQHGSGEVFRHGLLLLHFYNYIFYLYVIDLLILGLDVLSENPIYIKSFDS